MMDELLADRGVTVSHETVRQWALKFGQVFANPIRRKLPHAGDKWHLDEVVIKIVGVKHWLRRAVGQNAMVLDGRSGCLALAEAPLKSFIPRIRLEDWISQMAAIGLIICRGWARDFLLACIFSQQGHETSMQHPASRKPHRRRTRPDRAGLRRG
jgi:putative transposase